MHLDENLKILRDNFKNIYDNMLQIQENINAQLIKIEPSRKNVPTLVIEKEGKLNYIHSKYDPIREAETIINQIRDINEYDHVLFYGVGLGYHTKVFINKYPNKKFSIYEPRPQIFYKFLEYQSLEDISFEKFKSIGTGIDNQSSQEFIKSILERNNEKILIIELPSYKRLFLEERQCFIEQYQKVVNEKKTVNNVNALYEKLWISNSMKNFKYILNTPNILLEKSGKFKNKPALLVAAGPSLEDEIENIRYIKDNGLAYIFSVGSSIKSLLENNILPHAVCSYDPQEYNHLVYNEIIENDITTIPLIFGSSVGYKTVDLYPGPKYHMVMSTDKISQYYLKSKGNNKLEIINDAPTISAVALQLLYKLGFNPIILVGQNLAYKEGKLYTDREMNEIQLKKIEGSLEKRIIKDVNGKDVYSNDDLNIMRGYIEKTIEDSIDVSVINSTKNGAKVKGTVFVPLKKVINNDLKEKIYDKKWLDEESIVYDIDYLIDKYELMNKEYEVFNIILSQFIRLLDSINNYRNKMNSIEASKLNMDLDRILEKMQENKFFQIFVLPRNKSNWNLLVKNIYEINNELDSMRRIKKICKELEIFIDLCNEDLTNINNTFRNLNEEIQDNKVNILTFTIISDI